ncbi:MAG: hypothetical protein LBN99_02890 [Oscillospiraceae bacterium]|nr:hypothetical protein [Oscillospiraceae bacterium]
MTTVTDVFAITMALIDELGERTGEPDAVETRDYQQRAPGIITALLGELRPYSAGYSPSPGARAALPAITGLGDEVPLDDFLCRTVLPCALASRLLLDENPSVAAFYERRYMELLRYGAAPAGSSEPIRDLYGGVGVCQ